LGKKVTFHTLAPPSIEEKKKRKIASAIKKRWGGGPKKVPSYFPGKKEKKMQTGGLKGRKTNEKNGGGKYALRNCYVVRGRTWPPVERLRRGGKRKGGSRFFPATPRKKREEKPNDSFTVVRNTIKKGRKKEKRQLGLLSTSFQKGKR